MLNQNLLLTGDDGYNLTKSLRFRSSASAYLNRTPASSGNRRTFTISAWVKRGSLGIADAGLFTAWDGTNRFYPRFEADNKLNLYIYTGGSAYDVATSMVFRDPAAWYHIVLAVDTTQATDTNRIKVYVNGVQQTLSGTYPPQNTDTQWNYTVQQNIGKKDTSGSYFDGYMTEINAVDGQALTPSSFGSTNALTGVWQPAKYTGTYGTNGFYLPFTDVATTSGSNAGLGKDFSGNGNYWNTNNISVTAGTTYDSMNDVPTLTSATQANYAVFNPLQTRIAAPTTYSNGNLRTQFSDTGIYQLAFGTIGIKSNKYYWEVTVAGTGTQGFIGIADINSSASDVPSIQRVYANNGQKSNYSSSTSYGASYTAGDVIGVAVDADSGTITFYKNNTSQGTAFTDIVSAMPSGGWTAFAYGYNGTDLSTNFGQQPFSYTPPTGFVALNTYNLPTSTIVKGNTVMDATLYTGNGTGQAIVNSGSMKPDFIWIKSRSAAYNHGLVDTVRGINKHLYSNLTNAEGTCTAGKGITAINSNGFTLGTESDTAAPMNENGVTFVGWQWQAGQGTTSSNTDGTITSTVSVNATAGFSVVTYTGNATAGATVGHGLGVAPSIVIAKPRSASGNWLVYTAALGNTYTLRLQSTAAADANIGYWNNTSPTSSVFSLGSGSDANQSGVTNVAYCWSEVAGFSKFGSMVGNGSTDGTFVYTGFRPKFILMKSSSAAEQWNMWDASRIGYNPSNYFLGAQSASAEDTTNSGSNSNGGPDFLSNGFKMRSTGGSSNTSGGTYIYMAFAENPFKNSLAR